MQSLHASLLAYQQGFFVGGNTKKNHLSKQKPPLFFFPLFSAFLIYLPSHQCFVHFILKSPIMVYWSTYLLLLFYFSCQAICYLHLHQTFHFPSLNSCYPAGQKVLNICPDVMSKFTFTVYTYFSHKRATQLENCFYMS